VSSQREATVVRPTTWFLDGAGRRVMETSMGTRLPVRDTTPDAVVVATPDGASLRVNPGDVSVTAPGAPALPPSAASVVRVARIFEGLPYLWGGTSGFGFDCSGLTYLAYRM